MIDEEQQDEAATSNGESWTLCYNGTDNYWIIKGDMDRRYRFRVRALNAYGFGAWSRSSNVIDLTDSAVGGLLANQQQLGLILGLTVPVIAFGLICFCYFLCRKLTCNLFEMKLLSRIYEIKIQYSFNSLQATQG